MKIRLTTVYDYPSTQFLELLATTKSFRFITSPMLTFAPSTGTWPERWATGRSQFSFSFLGLIPLGKQYIDISYPDQSVKDTGRVIMRDNGEGTLMQRWDHLITVAPEGANRTHYVDEVEVKARYLAPVLTPFFALFAYVFYSHRQRRWKKFLLQQKNH